MHLPRLTPRRRGAKRVGATWLRRVMASGSFYTRFEPIVSLADQRVIGHEALTRFVDDVPPAVAFEAAVRSGLDGRLELATLRAAVGAARRLPPGGYLSLNATPHLIVNATDEMLDCLRDADRPVVVELLEEPRVVDWPALRAALQRLTAEARVQVAVDDLGGAFAGLLYLLELRPAIIKLERSVAAGVEHDEGRRSLLRALNDYAREAGAVLVVEGVETETQQDALVSLGLPYAQGYLYPAS